MMKYHVWRAALFAALMGMFCACQTQTEKPESIISDSAVEMRSSDDALEYNYKVGYVVDGEIETFASFDEWNESFKKIVLKATEMDSELENIILSTGESGDEIPYMGLQGVLANGDLVTIYLEGELVDAEGGLLLRVSTRWFIGCRGTCGQYCLEDRNINGQLIGCNCFSPLPGRTCKLVGLAFPLDDYLPY